MNNTLAKKTINYSYIPNGTTNVESGQLNCIEDGDKKIFAITFEYPLDHLPNNNLSGITYRQYLKEYIRIEIPEKIINIKILNLIPEEILPFEERTTLSLLNSPFKFDYLTLTEFLVGLKINETKFLESTEEGELIIIYGHGYDGQSIGQQSLYSTIFVKSEPNGTEIAKSVGEITRKAGRKKLPFESKRFVRRLKRSIKPMQILRNKLPIGKWGQKLGYTPSANFSHLTTIQTVIRQLNESNSPNPIAGICLATCNVNSSPDFTKLALSYPLLFGIGTFRVGDSSKFQPIVIPPSVNLEQ